MDRETKYYLFSFLTVYQPKRFTNYFDVTTSIVSKILRSMHPNIFNPNVRSCTATNFCACRCVRHLQSSDEIFWGLGCNLVVLQLLVFGFKQLLLTFQVIRSLHVLVWLLSLNFILSYLFLINLSKVVFAFALGIPL